MKCHLVICLTLTLFDRFLIFFRSRKTGNAHGANADQTIHLRTVRKLFVCCNYSTEQLFSTCLFNESFKILYFEASGL